LFFALESVQPIGVSLSDWIGFRDWDSIVVEPGQTMTIKLARSGRANILMCQGLDLIKTRTGQTVAEALTRWIAPVGPVDARGNNLEAMSKLDAVITAITLSTEKSA
jgi:hypothetical protein